MGDALGLIIPTEALAQLNVREGDAVFLAEAAQAAVILSARNPRFAEKTARVDALIQRYRNALGECAE